MTALSVRVELPGWPTPGVRLDLPVRLVRWGGLGLAVIVLFARRMCAVLLLGAGAASEHPQSGADERDVCPDPVWAWGARPLHPFSTAWANGAATGSGLMTLAYEDSSPHVANSPPRMIHHERHPESRPGRRLLPASYLL